MSRSFSPLLIVVASLFIVAFGCSSEDNGGDDGNQDDAGVQDTARPDTSTPDVAAEVADEPDVTITPDLSGEPEPETFVTMTAMITDILSENPIDMVQVCVFESDIPCVNSVNGAVTLPGVPGFSQLYLQFTQSEYFPTIAAYETTDEDFDWDVVLADNATVDFQATLIGEEVDPLAGQVAFGTLDPATDEGVAGVSVTFSADTGLLVFSSDLGLPDPSRTETSANGAGVIVNVDPGVYTLTLDYPGGSCTPYLGWEADGPGTISVRVVAGVATSVSAWCE